MANEVVAHYLDGRVVKGVSLDVDPGRPVCHIRTPAEGTLEVKLKDLKALFFVQDLAGNSGRSDVLALEPGDGRARGAYPIELEFADGERLMSGCGPAERGCNRSYYVMSQVAHATRQFLAGGRSETFQE